MTLMLYLDRLMVARLARLLGYDDPDGPIRQLRRGLILLNLHGKRESTRVWPNMPAGVNSGDRSIILRDWLPLSDSLDEQCRLRRPLDRDRLLRIQPWNIEIDIVRGLGFRDIAVGASEAIAERVAQLISLVAEPESMADRFASSFEWVVVLRY